MLQLKVDLYSGLDFSFVSAGNSFSYISKINCTRVRGRVILMVNMRTRHSIDRISKASCRVRVRLSAEVRVKFVVRVDHH